MIQFDKLYVYSLLTFKPMKEKSDSAHSYWKANLSITFKLLINNKTDINEKDKLENPINDALKMEETFRKLDFDSIIVKKNLDYSQLKNTFSKYGFSFFTVVFFDRVLNYINFTF